MGHSHRKLPIWLMQTPPAQMAGISPHSSMSGEGISRQGQPSPREHLGALSQGAPQSGHGEHTPQQFCGGRNLSDTREIRMRDQEQRWGGGEVRISRLKTHWLGPASLPLPRGVTTWTSLEGTLLSEGSQMREHMLYNPRDVK